MDLLSGEDGLGGVARRPEVVKPDAETLAMLAELERPAVRSDLAAADGGGLPAGDGAADAAGGSSWVDTMASWLTAAPVSSEGTAGVDLLAEDDSLGEVGRGRGGPTTLSADDPAMQLLASLDDPTARRAAAAGQAPPAEETWVDSVVAWAVGAPAAPEPEGEAPPSFFAPGVPALPEGAQAAAVPNEPVRRPAPRASTAAVSAPIDEDRVRVIADHGEWVLPESATDGSWVLSIAALAQSMVAPETQEPAPAPAPSSDLAGAGPGGDRPDPAILAMLAELPPGMSVRDWSKELPAGARSAGPVSAEPCLDAELCDTTLQTWRDGVWVGETLYTEEEIRLMAQAEAWMQSVFYRPGEEVPAAMEQDLRLRTMVVRIDVDVPGAPVELDGTAVGAAPTIAEVSPGRHWLKIWGDEDTYSMFQVEARSDPDEWCFEAHGRQFKRILCK